MTRFLELLAILAVTIALAWVVVHATAPRGASDARFPDRVEDQGLRGVPLRPVSPAERDATVLPDRSGLGSGVPRPAVAATRAVIPPLAVTGTLTGLASWYDNGPGLYGAAGPVLRHALGANWRGSHVIVCHGRCVVIVLSDWCACGPRHGQPTLIDLSRDAFRRIATLSRGIASVTIETGVPVLPPTDTAP